MRVCTQWANQTESRRFQAHYLHDAHLLKNAVDSHNPFLASEAVRRLVKSAQELSSLRNLPLLRAVQEIQNNSEETEEILESYFQTLAEADSTDERSQAVIEHLLAGGETFELLGDPSLGTLARSYERTFNRWLARTHPHVGRSSERDLYWRRFLQGLSQGTIQRLLTRLEHSETPPQHPLTVIRQASAWIRNFRISELDLYADELDARLSRLQTIQSLLVGGQP
jgi:hypothetical protein